MDKINISNNGSIPSTPRGTKQNPKPSLTQKNDEFVRKSDNTPAKTRFRRLKQFFSQKNEQPENKNEVSDKSALENDKVEKMDKTEKIEQKKYSKEDIAEIISEHNYETFVEGLIKNGRASNSVGVISFFTKPNKETILNICLKNFDTMRVEQYLYSLDEFLEIAELAKEKSKEKYPDKKDTFDPLFEKLSAHIQKLKNPEQNK